MRLPVAILLALCLTAATASAGTNFTAETYRVVKGTDNGGTLASVQTTDGSFAEISAVLSRGERRATFEVTFIDVPPDDPINELRFVGHTSPKSTCTMTISAYKWNKRRFVVWGTPQPVLEGPTNSDFAVRRDVINAFVKNGRVRARYSCRSEATFVLRTDRASMAN